MEAHNLLNIDEMHKEESMNIKLIEKRRRRSRDRKTRSPYPDTVLGTKFVDVSAKQLQTCGA